MPLIARSHVDAAPLASFLMTQLSPKRELCVQYSAETIDYFSSREESPKTPNGMMGRIFEPEKTAIVVDAPKAVEAGAPKAVEAGAPKSEEAAADVPEAKFPTVRRTLSKSFSKSKEWAAWAVYGSEEDAAASPEAREAAADAPEAKRFPAVRRTLSKSLSKSKEWAAWAVYGSEEDAAPESVEATPDTSTVLGEEATPATATVVC